MMPALYNLLLLLAAPAALAYYTYRHLRRGRLRQGWAERFGRLPAALVARCRGREVLWVHAVSVGETNAARALIAELRRRRPQAVIVLSHVTETGRATAAGAKADGLFYLPVEWPGAIRRVIDQLRPRLLVTVDTELWPNLFDLVRRSGAKLAVSNGRISDRSLKRIQRFRAQWLYRWVLAQPHRLLMQSDLDAGRVRYLGAAAEQVQVTGNLKVDEAYPEVSADRLAWWQQTLGLAPSAPVLLAGSTGPGEEAILLAAYQQLRSRHAGLRLVLVPRAVERAGEIAGLCAEAGLSTVRRSALPGEAERSAREEAVVIVDTIGELSELYAVGSLCFVGRSLVPMGGSNVLQAAAQGRPVLSGPFVNNVRDSVAWLVDQGACRIVADEAAIVAVAEEWLSDAAAAARTGELARAVTAANRGATARTVSALIELLDE